MSFDAKKYLKHLEGRGMTEAQKLEHIREVRKILENFIDSAFGTHAVQLLPKKDLQSPKGNVESRRSTYFSKNATEYRNGLHLHSER